MAQADEQRRGGAPDELVRLVALASELRELIPPELDLRLSEAAHELLLALRALIDWLLEHQQREVDQPAEVQDIPIL
jgi:DNA-binding HxlR family transcriptional regulator